jgi:hypothetical protein
MSYPRFTQSGKTRVYGVEYNFRVIKWHIYDIKDSKSIFYTISAFYKNRSSIRISVFP